MARRRARLLEQERPEGHRLRRLERKADGAAGGVEPVAREVLRLQRDGGNTAVGTMLAQRDTGGKDADKPITATLVMSDPIGVLELISVSLAPGRRGGGGGGTKKTPQEAQEFSVVVASSAQDSVLQEYAAKGRKVDSVHISSRSLDITLENVYITGFQVSGGGGDRPTISMTLVPETKETDGK